jgi:hypothetical protein
MRDRALTVRDNWRTLFPITLEDRSMAQNPICLKKRQKTDKQTKEMAHKRSDVVLKESGLQLDAIIRKFLIKKSEFKRKTGLKTEEIGF